MDSQIKSLLEARTKARASRQWIEADRLRDVLAALGWTCVDSRENTRLVSRFGISASKPSLFSKDSIFQSLIDKDGKTWGYCTDVWDREAGALRRHCNIDDVRSQSVAVRARPAEREKRKG